MFFLIQSQDLLLKFVKISFHTMRPTVVNDLGLLFVQYDSRIRSAKTIVNILKIPVLVEIDDFKDRSTIEIERKKSVVLSGLIIFTAVIYIYASIQKYLGIF